MLNTLVLDRNETNIEKIYKTLGDNSNVFLTGAAGVGKSTIVSNIIRMLREDGLSVAATATTGVASLNIDGITIHKFLGINIQKSIDCIPLLKSKPLIWSSKSRVIASTDIIIVDEISMISMEQFELIDKVLREYTKIDAPFGGKRMIFVGDFLQLPPVNRNGEITWAFQSNSWTKGNIKSIVLNKVMRQSCDAFSNLLGKVRLGIYDHEIKTFFKEVSKSCSKDIRESIPNLVSLNEYSDSINLERLEQITDSQLFVYKAKISGASASLKEQITKACIAKKSLLIKVGARVMAVYNCAEGQYINGSLGTVISCKPKFAEVLFDNGNNVKVNKKDWSIIDSNGIVKAKLTQIPLVLAYATTIHKSQGLTLDSLYLNANNIFAPGQLYTALSRCKNIENLYVENLSKDALIVNEDALNFTLSLEKK